MLVPPSRYRAFADRFERTLVALFRAGRAGSVLCVLAFGGYLTYAFGTGRMDASRPLASLGASAPAQGILFLIGVSFCLMNASLVCYVVLTGVEDLRSGLGVVFGCAGFGCGAGLVKLTGPVVVNTLVCL